MYSENWQSPARHSSFPLHCQDPDEFVCGWSIVYVVCKRTACVLGGVHDEINAAGSYF